MGVPDAGQLPCWEWEDWPALLANTISWLVEPATQPRPPSPELLAKMRAELLGPGVKKAESHGKAITRYARIPGGTDSTLTLLKAVSILDGDVPPDLADTVWDSVRPTLSAAANAVARDLLTGAASAKKSLGLRALGQMQTADARALLEEAFKNPDAGGPDDDLEGGMQETITEDPAVAAVTIRLGALEGLGNLGNPAALPLLKNAVRQYQRVMTNPANLAREVTPEDELYHEAVLSALRCGDVSAAAPVVDMLLENRYVFIRMMSFLDGPDYPGPEHEATRREKRRIIRELPRVYRRIARLHAKLNSLPSAVLPALAKRIAAEEDHRVAPIAFAIFGANGKPSPDVLAILRAAKVPAVRELANIP
ncbi:MAG: PBS lyase HEAT-like repeat protein [bacterium ADurb.Bin429]|nr:MAG: PBS lyase HEAT-like repeat protein [bacterium ADurb.Bin429]